MLQISEILSGSQLVGYLATAVSLSAYTMRDDKLMKTGVGAGLLLWAVHYAMLSAWTASLTCLLISSRQILVLISPSMNSSKRRIAAWGYGAVFTVVLWQTWTGAVSLLPWVSALNATYAYFYLKGVRLRAQVLLSTGLWLANAAFLGSIGGVVMNAASICLSLWTIRRLHKTS